MKASNFSRLCFVVFFISLFSIEALSQKSNNPPPPSTPEKTRRFLVRYLNYMDTAPSFETRVQILKGIEIVANAVKTDWISQYHASYYNAVCSMESADSVQKENLMSGAQGYYNTAAGLAPSEPEVMTLKAVLMIAELNQRAISKDSVLACIKLLEQSRKTNANNPRTLTMLGKCYLILPEKEGRDKKKAADLLKTAIKKFDSDRHEDPAWPHWGKTMAESLLKEATEK